MSSVGPSAISAPETPNSALDNDEDRYRFMGLLEDLDNTTQSNILKSNAQVNSARKLATEQAAAGGQRSNSRSSSVAQ